MTRGSISKWKGSKTALHLFSQHLHFIRNSNDVMAAQLLKGTQMSEASIRSLFAGNSLPKGPRRLRAKNLISLQIPYNNISFKQEKHRTSSQGSAAKNIGNKVTGRIQHLFLRRWIERIHLRLFLLQAVTERSHTQIMSFTFCCATIYDIILTSVTPKLHRFRG